MRKFWTSFWAALAIIMLILDAKYAYFSAVEGVYLCIYTILPTLFPFFFLSVLLTNALTGRSFRFLKPIGRLCRMPRGSESILAIGLLGGYPVGAQAISQAYEGKQISCKDAQRLLGFCSNAGPSFLFGLIGAQFDAWYIPWFLWLIHVVSAVLVGLLLPCTVAETAHIPRHKPISVTDGLKKAIQICAVVCGWVLMFRIIIGFLSRWLLWLLPTATQTALYGILELANGCTQLRCVENIGLRYTICAGMLAFGGLCVAMQTASVSQKIGLGMYFPGKLLQCIISVFLALLTQNLFLQRQQIFFVPLWVYVLILILGVGICFFLHKSKKSCSNLLPVGV